MYRAGQVKLCFKRIQRKETRANQVTEMYVLHRKISDVIYIPLSYMIPICVTKLKTQVWIKDPVVII